MNAPPIIHRAITKNSQVAPFPGNPAVLAYELRTLGFPPRDLSRFGLFWISDFFPACGRILAPLDKAVKDALCDYILWSARLPASPCMMIPAIRDAAILTEKKMLYESPGEVYRNLTDVVTINNMK